jgi:hypothetical protein
MDSELAGKVAVVEAIGQNFEEAPDMVEYLVRRLFGEEALYGVVNSNNEVTR